MPNEDHYRKLENMMHSAPIAGLTGVRIRIERGKAEITLPVRKVFFHTAGAMHGALYFLALDNAAYFSVSSLVTDVFILTTSFNTYLIRPVTEGVVKAVGAVVNAGKTRFIAEAKAYDGRGREIARGSGEFVRSGIRLSPEVGYKDLE